MSLCVPSLSGGISNFDLEAAMCLQERRRAERHIGNIGAVIIVPSGEHLSCIVRDFSKSRACLLVTSALGLPSEFYLHPHGGPTRKVASVWRGAGKVGVQFI